MFRIVAIGALAVGCNAILDNEKHSLAEPTDAAIDTGDDGDARRSDDAKPSADSTPFDGTASDGTPSDGAPSDGTPSDGATPSDRTTPSDGAKPADGPSPDARAVDAGCTGDCRPGATGSQTVGCGACGTKTQSRTCSASCVWGAWIDSSACSAPSVCDCSEVQYCQDPDTGGTTCLQHGCTGPQALAECMMEIPNVCGATRQPFTMKYQ